LTELPGDVTTTSPDDVTWANASGAGSEFQQQHNDDDVTMPLVLGITVGGVSVMVTVVACVVVWLTCRRRRRQRQRASETSSDDVSASARLDPETADNRLNESSALPRNNAVAPPCGRYTRDGTLVLTVTNNCAGTGSDVTLQCAGRGASADTKNGKAARRTSTSPAGKPGVSTVNDDVTRFTRITADDVNVWPYSGGADDCQAAGSLRVVRRGGKYDNDCKRLRRGSSTGVCFDARKYRSKYRHKANASTDDDERRWSRDYASFR